ncbi:hypothetical protein ACHAQJ_005670 [Trichoderma viride]
MCKEYLTIAVCAPQKAPHMSFTCGKLHLVAERREVCDKATGKCLCFVGTCGSLENISSAKGVVFSSLKPIRCAGCTSREEEVGDRRSKEELIASPLLTRAAIQTPEEMKEFEVILKKLWGGKSQCPFHAPPAISEEVVEDANETAAANTHVKVVVKLPAVKSSEVTDGHASDQSSQSSNSSMKSKHSNGLGRKVGIESSIWADAKDEAPQRGHKSPPRFKTPRQLQKPVSRGGRRFSYTVRPMMAAAKDFLGDKRD